MSCLEEMGILSELASEYKGSGMNLIGLSADVASGDDVSKAQELFKSSGGRFTNLTYTNSVLTTILKGVNVVPTTKFYDSSGRLLTTVHGAKSKQGWIDIIETVMNEKA